MSKLAALSAQLPCRLAQVVPAIGAGSSTVGSDYSWNDKGANKKDGRCDYEKDAFHGCFLLVTADWTVIFSRRKGRPQWVRKPSIVRNL